MLDQVAMDEINYYLGMLAVDGMVWPQDLTESLPATGWPYAADAPIPPARECRRRIALRALAVRTAEARVEYWRAHRQGDRAGLALARCWLHSIQCQRQRTRAGWV